MSGGIVLGMERSWIVAGWAADNAVEYMRPFLRDGDSALVLSRLERMNDFSGALARFEDATAEEVRLLRDAARQGRDAAATNGGADWAEPEFFPGFLARFDDLIDLLEQDPRVSAP